MWTEGISFYLHGVPFIAAIAYGKGFILSEQYQGNMNGEELAQFIRTHFKSAFERRTNPKGKLFLQDRDPSQNCRKAQNTMYAVDAKKFSVPPRSPDANPIENVFNQVKRQLRLDALHQKIRKESFKQFSYRIKRKQMGEGDLLQIFWGKLLPSSPPRC